MIPDSIEREIRIDAPVETVWRMVTEPEHIAQWFSEEAELDLREGGDGVLTFHHAGDGRGTVHAPLVVVRVDPPRAFAFRWSAPEGTRPDGTNSTLVEFTLAEHGGGTLLRLVESGIATLAWADDEARASFLEDHRKGWDELLPRLVPLAAGVPVAR